MRLTDYHFLQEIAALDVVDAIYLFGSRARGDNRERSDIDIAVLCPRATKKDWLSIQNNLAESAKVLFDDLGHKLGCGKVYDEINLPKNKLCSELGVIYI